MMIEIRMHMYKIHNKRRFARLCHNDQYRSDPYIYRILVNRFSTDLFSF